MTAEQNEITSNNNSNDEGQEEQKNQQEEEELDTIESVKTHGTHLLQQICHSRLMLESHPTFDKDIRTLVSFVESWRRDLESNDLLQASPALLQQQHQLTLSTTTTTLALTQQDDVGTPRCQLPPSTTTTSSRRGRRGLLPASSSPSILSGGGRLPGQQSTTTRFPRELLDDNDRDSLSRPLLVDRDYQACLTDNNNNDDAEAQEDDECLMPQPGSDDNEGGRAGRLLHPSLERLNSTVPLPPGVTITLLLLVAFFAVFGMCAFIDLLLPKAGNRPCSNNNDLPEPVERYRKMWTCAKELSPDGGKALGISTSPQAQAIEWFQTKGRSIPAPPAAPAATCSWDDSDFAQMYALFILKQSVQIPDNNKWFEDPDKPFCQWPRVGCDGNKKIQKLSLEEATLKGSLPREIGGFVHLTSLQTTSNAGLVGTIPTEVGSLPKLRTLDLHFTGIKGTIPKELGQLGELEELLLDHTNLSGSVPTEVCRLNLTTIHVDKNVSCACC